MKVATVPQTNEKSIPPERLLLTVPQVADALGGLARSYVYVLLSRGDIPTVKIGKRTLIRATDLDNYVKSLPSGNFAGER